MNNGKPTVEKSKPFASICQSQRLKAETSDSSVSDFIKTIF